MPNRCERGAGVHRANTVAESDGTLEWDATTLVYVEVKACGRTGIGYTYADVATATLIKTMLRNRLLGKDAMQTGARRNDVGNAAPAGMDISIGEHGYGLYEFARMLDTRCVDVLQADATRCGGFSGVAVGISIVALRKRR